MESTQADLEAVVSRDANMINTLVEIGVSPIDEHNTTLLDNVHPANWQDAEPDGVRFRIYCLYMYSWYIRSGYIYIFSSTATHQGIMLHQFETLCYKASVLVF